MKILRRLKLGLRALFGADDLNRELGDEVQFHIDMQTEENLRAGMPPGEARRQARLKFGGVEGHKEESRRVKGMELMGARISWLDIKLGMRMLVKFPGLTIVGGLAVTVAIGLTATWFEITSDMLTPTLPFEDGDRVVAIQNFDTAEGEPVPGRVHDLASWREELRTVEDIGAAAYMNFNMSTDDDRFRTVEGARMTASASEVHRVSPQLGRSLTAADESPSSPPVAVISHALWQDFFEGSRGAIGQTVKLGTTPTTIVGVMPEGFGFPVNQDLWIPLQANPLEYQRGEGPALRIFGRLAPGFSLEEAQAELSTVGMRTAAEFPQAYERLRPGVEGYAQSFTGGGALLLSAFNLPFLLIMVVICANVATLVFARTAMREGELAMRSALGASRKRLVLQLFVEALVLTSLAAVTGLLAAYAGLRWGMGLFWEVQQSQPPFWVDGSLSLKTILYVAALAIFGAVLVGVFPALKATRRNVKDGLGWLGAGGASLRFGAISTGVIVVQIALCVIFLPIAVMRGQDALEGRVVETGFPADEYLSGTLTRQMEVSAEAPWEAGSDEFVARTAELRDEVRRRLAEEPGITGVAYASRLPGLNHVQEMIEIEADVLHPDSALSNVARPLAVSLDYFEVVDAPIIAGRGFQPSDLESAIGAVIVDQNFVQYVMDGRNPVGQRLSYPGRSDGETTRWYQVVGVVEDPGPNSLTPGTYVGVYHPLRPGEQTSLQMFLRTDVPNVETLVPQVHALVSSVDPSMGVDQLKSVQALWLPAHRGEDLVLTILLIVVAGIVSLSAAGIYALMSFTVSRRGREIAIRVALGAGPARVVTAIFSRALAQVGLGVMLGGLIFGFAFVQDADDLKLTIAMAAVMMTVGLLACVVPATRALRVHPTDALKEA